MTYKIPLYKGVRIRLNQPPIEYAEMNMDLFREVHRIPQELSISEQKAGHAPSFFWNPEGRVETPSCLLGISLDYDDPGLPSAWKQALQSASIPFGYAAWETLSSRRKATHPRIRICIPFRTPMPFSQADYTWNAACLAAFFGKILDMNPARESKDTVRPWFLPARTQYADCTPLVWDESPWEWIPDGTGKNTQEGKDAMSVIYSWTETISDQINEPSGLTMSHQKIHGKEDTLCRRVGMYYGDSKARFLSLLSSLELRGHLGKMQDAWTIPQEDGRDDIKLVLFKSCVDDWRICHHHEAHQSQLLTHRAYSAWQLVECFEDPGVFFPSLKKCPWFSREELETALSREELTPELSLMDTDMDRVSAILECSRELRDALGNGWVVREGQTFSSIYEEGQTVPPQVIHTWCMSFKTKPKMHVPMKVFRIMYDKASGLLDGAWKAPVPTADDSADTVQFPKGFNLSGCRELGDEWTQEEVDTLSSVCRREDRRADEPDRYTRNCDDFIRAWFRRSPLLRQNIVRYGDLISGKTGGVLCEKNSTEPDSDVSFLTGMDLHMKVMLHGHARIPEFTATKEQVGSVMEASADLFPSFDYYSFGRFCAGLWDGKDRNSVLLPELGAKDGVFTREVMNVWLGSWFAMNCRRYTDPLKPVVSQMILWLASSVQGTGKSSMLEYLERSFAALEIAFDTGIKLSDLQKTDYLPKIMGKSPGAISEKDIRNKSGHDRYLNCKISHIVSFDEISVRDDVFIEGLKTLVGSGVFSNVRRLYTQTVFDVKRTSIMSATTNKRNFLSFAGKTERRDMPVFFHKGVSTRDPEHFYHKNGIMENDFTAVAYFAQCICQAAVFAMDRECVLSEEAEVQRKLFVEEHSGLLALFHGIKAAVKKQEMKRKEEMTSQTERDEWRQPVDTEDPYFQNFVRSMGIPYCILAEKVDWMMELYHEDMAKYLYGEGDYKPILTSTGKVWIYSYSPFSDK